MSSDPPSNFEQLEQLEQAGSLRRVLLIEWTNDEPGLWVEAIELEFEQRRCLVTAIGDDDTVRVTVGPGPPHAELWPERLPEDRGPFVAHDISAQSPWRECLGRPLIWAWVMSNHRYLERYNDAVQFQFDPQRSIQLVTVASELRLFTATEQPWTRP